MTAPYWALALAYWLHMLATVVWIGSMAALALLVTPAAHRSLKPAEYASLLGTIQRRLDPLGWFCLVLLVGTGLLQMSANPNYQGFLGLGNRWATAILVKHVFFLVMVGVSAYLTWGAMPRLHRLALKRMKASNPAGLESEEAKLVKQETRLIQINLLLGVLVILMTALARAA